MILEEDVPYDRSVLWRLHDAYFAARGADAWLTGEVPYRSTSNFAAARQHARVVEAAVRELDLAPDAPIGVLEIGCGLGEFCVNFFRAFDPALAPRLRYVLSDGSDEVVAGAIVTPELRRLVDAGQVLPRRFDVREPDKLDVEIPLAAVIANYVCCATPMKVLRRFDGTWSEARCSVASQRPLEDLLADPNRERLVRDLEIAYDWHDAPLAELLPDAFHAAVVESAARAYPRAILRYPYAFLEALRQVRGRMLPGGLMLVSDYGSADGVRLKTSPFKGADLFGNSLANAVDFTLFDHFCAVAGASCGRTQGVLRSVHTAAIRFGAMSMRFAEAFVEHEQNCNDSEDLIDFTAAARKAVGGNGADPARAVRFFERSLALDPYSAALHHEAADACIDAGLYEMASSYLDRAAELDERGELDLDLERGRIHLHLDRPAEALACLQKSLARSEHPAVLCNVALAQRKLGQKQEAYSSARRAVQLAPDDQRAKKLADDLLTEWIGPPDEDQNGAIDS